MAPGTTATGICRDIFGCDASGVTRRMQGETGIYAVELSQLVARLGIDADGVFPEDLTLPPDVLRQKLKDAHLGIYSRQASVGLLRALQSFAGAQGRVRIERVKHRGSAFTAAADVAEPTWQQLFVGDAVRFVCDGPSTGRLMLLDYAADGQDVMLLMPSASRDWRRPDAVGRITFPDSLDAPLKVMPVEGNRHASAVWLVTPFAEGFDQNPTMTVTLPATEADPGPEFRTLSPIAIRALQNALNAGKDGPILAADTVTYRVSDW